MDERGGFINQLRCCCVAGRFNDKLFPVWVDDQRFVYDTLEIWMTNDPLLRGRLDLTRLGSLGHSFDGATALEVCRIDMRCRAAVNLDGGHYGDIVTIPAVRPLMLMTSAESYENQEAVSAWRRMMAVRQRKNGVVAGGTDRIFLIWGKVINR